MVSIIKRVTLQKNCCSWLSVRPSYNNSRDAEVCTVHSAECTVLLSTVLTKNTHRFPKEQTVLCKVWAKIYIRAHYFIWQVQSRVIRFRITAGRAITIFRESRYKQFGSTYYSYVLTTLSKPWKRFIRHADSRHTAQTLYAKFYERTALTGKRPTL